MKQTLYILGFIAVVLWLVTGCAPPTVVQDDALAAIPTPAPGVKVEWIGRMYRVIDRQAGVVCYTTGASDGHLQCFLMAETRLDE